MSWIGPLQEMLGPHVGETYDFPRKKVRPAEVLVGDRSIYENQIETRWP